MHAARSLARGDRRRVPPPRRGFPDPAHSRHEERFKAIGNTAEGRRILIVFTLRRRGADMLVRPIGARFMHATEVEYYEEEAAKAAQR